MTLYLEIQGTVSYIPILNEELYTSGTEETREFSDQLQ